MSFYPSPSDFYKQKFVSIFYQNILVNFVKSAEYAQEKKGGQKIYERFTAFSTRKMWVNTYVKVELAIWCSLAERARKWHYACEWEICRSFCLGADLAGKTCFSTVTTGAKQLHKIHSSSYPIY